MRRYIYIELFYFIYGDMTYELKSLNIESDNAYFAGLFDGEGCIGLYRRSDGTGYASSICITNTVKAPLDELVKFYGGKVVKKHTRINQKQVYNWQIYGENLINFINFIQPYLRIKNEQIKLFLKYKSISHKGINYSQHEYEEIDKISKDMRVLKHKGDKINPMSTL